MNQGLTIFKRMQRLQGGDKEVSPPLSDASQQAMEWLMELEDTWGKRIGEIPPILNKLPGQYQHYYPTQHEEVPIKRSHGRRYFDPSSLGEYPIMAQRGTENLEPGPLPPDKRKMGPKEAAGLYDPGPGEQEHDDEYAPGLTPEEIAFIRLEPDDSKWPKALRDKIFEQGYARGTSNVNQGLYFYRKQLKRKKQTQ